MHIDRSDTLRAAADGEAQTPLRELVMGVHWAPPAEDTKPGEAPANLDAACVLLDAAGAVVDLVHPGHPRNLNDSVLHTGDSRTGASAWDDERIFVFLDALPDSVAAVLFAVVSANGWLLSRVPGACCHVSEHPSERELVRSELGGIDRTTCAVAMARRRGTSWALVSPGEAGNRVERLLTAGAWDQAVRRNPAAAGRADGEAD